MTGKHIVIEGVDNSGKSTMAKRLVAWLQRDAGIQAIYARHPGSTALGGDIRKLIVDSHRPIDAHTRGLLFAADNSAFIHEILQPNIDNGTWIVSDRNNFISSMAYQISDGVPLDTLDKIHDATIASGFPKMDLLLILRASVETVRRRLEECPDKTDAYQKKMNDRKYFDKIMGAYNKLMEEQTVRLLKFVKPASSGVAPAGTPRCLFIDANGSVDEVFAAVQEAVKTVIHEQVAAL